MPYIQSFLFFMMFVLMCWILIGYYSPCYVLASLSSVALCVLNLTYFERYCVDTMMTWSDEFTEDNRNVLADC